MSGNRKIYAADLFCGAGGTSQGLLMAANDLKADLELIAINHWSVAIDTHSVNHPYARHLCTGLDEIGDPRKLVPGGRLNLLCGSPECTHHSVARGGKPMSDQSRSSAWHILRFAEALYIDNLIIENVPEFQSWGPLGANGRPLKSKRGQLFQQFIASLRALGYRVEWRVLNCADYGDPTTRRRLFVIARRNKHIRWPEPTHVPASALANAGLFTEHRKPWRTAREIIDWSIPSKSIFERKRPLAEKTLLRIQAGLKKFCGLDVDLKRCFAEDLRPFLVVLRGTGNAASVDEPLRTVTASGNHYGLVQPFLLPHPRENDAPHSIDRPMRTVTSSSSDLSLCEPFLIGQQSGAAPRGIGEPAPTVATAGAVSLTEPFLMATDQTGGNGSYTRSADVPIGTLVTKANQALVEPFMVTVNHGEGDTPRSAKSVDAPMGTITGSIGDGICEPFLIAYYGTKNMSGAGEPLPTVTARDRFGLVETEVNRYRLDIRFRMLQPRELARAQGFPDTYEFTGSREEVVKQIGNAVPPHTARALAMEVLA